MIPSASPGPGACMSAGGNAPEPPSPSFILGIRAGAVCTRRAPLCRVPTASLAVAGCAPRRLGSCDCERVHERQRPCAHARIEPPTQQGSPGPQPLRHWREAWRVAERRRVAMRLSSKHSISIPVACFARTEPFEGVVDDRSLQRRRDALLIAVVVRMKPLL